MWGRKTELNQRVNGTPLTTCCQGIIIIILILCGLELHKWLVHLKFRVLNITGERTSSWKVEWSKQNLQLSGKMRQRNLIRNYISLCFIYYMIIFPLLYSRAIIYPLIKSFRVSKWSVLWFTSSLSLSVKTLGLIRLLSSIIVLPIGCGLVSLSIRSHNKTAYVLPYAWGLWSLWP